MLDTELSNLPEIVNVSISNDGTYVTLPFPKPYKWKSEVKMRKEPLHRLSNEEYEELSDAIEGGKYKNLVELYYVAQMKGAQFPITITDPSLVVNEITEATLRNIPKKHVGVSFDMSLVDKAMHDIHEGLTKPNSLFEISPDIIEQIQPAVNKAIYRCPQGGVTFKNIFYSLNHIKQLMEEASNVSIITGEPGTGKTERAIRSLEDSKVLVISLSNVVGANFCARALNNFGYKNYDFWSYTKAHFLLRSGGAALEKYEAFVFEEASMLSSTELRIVETVLEHANENYEQVFFLGDEFQLPGFLGLGNLFSSLVTQFPNYVTRLVTNFRAKAHPNLVSVFEHVHDYTTFPKQDFPDVIKSSSDLANRNEAIERWLDDVEAGVDTFACTFRSNDAEVLNNAVLSGVFGINEQLDVGNNNQYPYKVAVFEALKGREFNLICTKNITKKTTNSTKYLAFNGERFRAIQSAYGRFSLQSLQFPEHTFDDESVKWVAANFDLGYAMTIHKLQGSEAVTVLYYEPALNPYLGNCNLRYVGVSRAKIKLYMAVNAANKPKFLNFRNIFTEI